MAVDPIEALKHQLARDKAEREALPARVAKFRSRHKVSDEQCLAMIRALKEGRAKTLEEAFQLTR